MAAQKAQPSDGRLGIRHWGDGSINLPGSQWL
jgi:hypothetical protein